ncbi:MAG: DnaJ domain-containing protein [Deltaproteobacteria bacterium]|nr:DnaJ domain-containing protein [Deltaproteobacteria bacterium]
MKDYYKILGLSSSSSEGRIRRAYRTLARRYHPDVNPNSDSADKFKDIAEAYRVLVDPLARRAYDAKYNDHLKNVSNAKIRAYQRAAEKRAATEKYFEQQKRDIAAIKAWQSVVHEGKGFSRIKALVDWTVKQYRVIKGFGVWLVKRVTQLFKERTVPHSDVFKVSVIEVPVTFKEAVYGAKKQISIDEPEGPRKIKVVIPPGVQTGTIVRLKSSSAPKEEVVLVVRLEKHPALSIDQNGLCVEIPITINEAVSGATIKVPGLDQELLVKLPPNTQSGAKIRVKDRGIPGGEPHGDLFVRVLVQVPESAYAVGLKEKSADLDLYYEKPVRGNLPKSLLEEWP